MTRADLVMTSGDTVRGWINYKGWDRKPSTTRLFRDSMGSTAVVYRASQIRSLEIAGVEIYERSVVRTDNLAADTLMLRLLVRGPRLDLYALGTEHFYLREKDSDFVSLVAAAVNENSDVRTPDLYKNALTACAFKYDLQELVPRIQGMTYDQGSLVKMALLLNGSIGQTYTGVIFKNTPHWFLGGGAGISGLDNSGDKSYLGRIAFKNTVAPYVTAGFDYLFSKGVGPLGVRAELTYFSATYKATGLATTTDLDHVDYTLRQVNVSPSVYLLYHFVNLRGFKVYGAAGVGANFASYPQNTYHDSFPDSTTTDNYTTMSSFWLSGNLKLGMILARRIEIGVAGIFGNYTREPTYSYDPHTYFCWLAFRIN